MASLARLAGIDVEQVRLIGSRRASALRAAGIESVADLLHHVPRRYLDRTERSTIARVPIGSEVTIVGKVEGLVERRPRKKLSIVEARVGDESGVIRAVWFNQPYVARRLSVGAEVMLSGVVEPFRGALQMRSPAYDLLGEDGDGLDTGRVVPIHPQVGEMRPGTIRSAVHNALVRSRPIEDPVPVEFLAAHGLMGRDQAFASIHFPDHVGDAAPARRRLVYDELFRLELALAMRKRAQKDQAEGIAHQTDGRLVGAFVAGLPYSLTGAQERVLGEIAADLGSEHPMHRLLQGEVGSGKTVVALAALLAGVESGWQGALMAPTEVLAEQHYRSVAELLRMAGLGPGALGVGERLGMESLFSDDRPVVTTALLTGSRAEATHMPGASRAMLLEEIAAGSLDLVVGTHALIQEGVEFGGLGVAVVDEQHRFGVAQRVTLRGKSGQEEPDLLIMTATPIPRTLAMTLYGDLDVSVLDEMPPGRVPVATVVLPKSEERVAWAEVEAEAEAGRQAFVVCPLVEDSPKVEAASATEEHRRLSDLMPGLSLGLMHGQLAPAEKEEVMARFREGAIDVLVTTTVIEVGIDVPNASVIVVEDADRFGLSQLHQLRGRVGRGEHPGRCILVSDPGTEEARRRLDAMASSTDGFVLAEEDLRIRGQGTVFGTRQSGMKDLKLADLLQDLDVLAAARRDAFSLVDSDPGLAGHPELASEVRAMLGESAEWLFVS